MPLLFASRLLLLLLLLLLLVLVSWVLVSSLLDGTALSRKHLLGYDAPKLLVDWHEGQLHRGELLVEACRPCRFHKRVKS
jgi:hypothetical protein